MKIKPIERSNGEIYNLVIPDMSSDKPGSILKEIIIELNDKVKVLEKQRNELLNYFIENEKNKEIR